MNTEMLIIRFDSNLENRIMNDGRLRTTATIIHNRWRTIDSASLMSTLSRYLMGTGTTMCCTNSARDALLHSRRVPIGNGNGFTLWPAMTHPTVVESIESRE